MTKKKTEFDYEAIMIIDPPITPYSSSKDIQAWIAELESWNQTRQVEDEIKQAKRWLNDDMRKELRGETKT